MAADRRTAHQVARLLSDPAAVGIRCASGVLDPSRRERDEEQDIDPLHERGLDGEEIAREHARPPGLAGTSATMSVLAPAPVAGPLRAAPCAPTSPRHRHRDPLARRRSAYI